MSKNITLSKVFPFIVIVMAVIGLLASFALTYDTLSIAHNPNYKPSCNLNPVISCGDVINTRGDNIFGLPYPYYGIAAFATLLTVGVTMLAGGKPNKYYWRAFLVVSGLGVIGAYALLLKSVFKIHALCPFCLSVDVATTTIFWYALLYIVDNKYLVLNNTTFKKIYPFIRRHHLDILLFWFILVIAFLLNHFWYYYGKHL